MEELISYLYNRYVFSEDSNLDTFKKNEGVKVHGLNEGELELYSPLIIRNVLAYSSTNMELKLSMPHIFAHIRLAKIESLLAEQKLQFFFEEWVSNQFMPIRIPHTRKIPTHTSFIFIDQPCEQKNAEQQEKKPRTKKRKTSHEMVMINLPQITKQLQNRVLIDNLQLEAKDVSKEEDRTSAKKKFQWIKVEEYIAEKYDRDTLMVFNFICSYPYMDEKELLARTMLSVIEMRKCVNNLIADGLVNFYAENSRTMLFKALKKERIVGYYRDHISQTLLNLLIFLEKQSEPEKSNIILRAISKIDDVLMIFI